MESDERQLLDSCLAGDEDARERLYSRHAGCVMAWLLRNGFARADADDLLQETFLRAFRSLATFDAARGSLRGWIGAIARNVVVDSVRRSNPPPVATVRDRAACPDPAREFDNREDVEQLLASIRRLPARDRELIALRFGAGHGNKAVAEELGMSEGNAAVRLHRALRRLRIFVEGVGALRSGRGRRGAVVRSTQAR